MEKEVSRNLYGCWRGTCALLLILLTKMAEARVLQDYIAVNKYLEISASGR